MNRFFTSSLAASATAARAACMMSGTELNLLIGKNPERGARPCTARGASNLAISSFPAGMPSRCRGRSGLSSGTAPVTWPAVDAVVEPLAQRLMQAPEDEVVRLGDADLLAGLTEVAGRPVGQVVAQLLEDGGGPVAGLRDQ